MRISRTLSESLLSPIWTERVTQFCMQQKWIADPLDLSNQRFLNRSVVPHVRKLSEIFNRKNTVDTEGLSRYWKNSSNPKNLQLAYFLLFHPSNAMRVAAVMHELQTKGFQFKDSIAALDLGSGMGAAPWGFNLALPEQSINWRLIEQDRSTLRIAREWLTSFDISCKAEPTQIDWKNLSRSVAGRDMFDLVFSSYCLNEAELPLADLAQEMIQFMNRRVVDGGLMIFVEPALKLQSRRLLGLRKEILKTIATDKRISARVLLPCLGNQVCGAFENPEDWCHEDVVWWRPNWLKEIDRHANLDHKSLPFSYLVLQKKKLSDSWPLNVSNKNAWRLVSPCHREGPKLEFYACGQAGKFRSRIVASKKTPLSDLERGDFLNSAQVPDSAIFEFNSKTKKL